MDLVLEQSLKNQNDKLMVVAVTQASFKPKNFQEAKSFAVLLVSQNFQLTGEIPYLQIEAREPVSQIETVFKFHN